MIGQLSNTVLARAASDYATVFRRGLISPVLFPRTMVTHNLGKVPIFSRDNLLTIPDTQLATSQSEAVQTSYEFTDLSYTCNKHAIKEVVALTDIEQAEGAFPDIIRDTLYRLVGKLETTQEKRVAAKLLALTGARVTTLTGDGTAATNRFANATGGQGGQPYTVISKHLNAMPIRGNIVIIPREVWYSIQTHSDFTDLVPNNVYKSITPEMLAQILQVDKVFVPEVNMKTTSSGTLSSVWGKNIVVAYSSMSGDIYTPTAGRTFLNKYASSSIDGWISRQWTEEKIGLKGGRWYQAGYEVDEILINPDLIHIIKSVIA